jgi:hypothetical protein
MTGNEEIPGRKRRGTVVNLKVEDYYPLGKRFLLRFKEKELPVHHKLEELLDLSR